MGPRKAKGFHWQALTIGLLALCGCGPGSGPAADGDAQPDTLIQELAAADVPAPETAMVDAFPIAETAALPTETTASSAPCFSLPNRAPGGKPVGQFGDVAVGQSKEQLYAIQNCGSAALKITKVQLDEDGADVPVEFAVDATQAVQAKQVLQGPISAANPLTIPANGSAVLRFKYSPANITPAGKADTANCLVEFASGQQFSIPLSGKGIDGKCPVAVAVVEQGSQVVPQTNLLLNSNSSYSPVGSAIVKYKWSVKQPLGCYQTMMPSAFAASPTLQANAPGEYQFCLDVWDQTGEMSCHPSCATVLVVPGGGIHVELLWDTPLDPDQSDDGPSAGADLDLHFAHPLASGLDIDCDGVGDPWFSLPLDAFWLNPNPQWGAAMLAADDPNLDLADPDGAGPENLSVQKPEGTLAEPMAFSVGVHYWNDHGYGPSYATLALYINGGLAYQMTKVKLQPLDMWYVGKLHWPNGLSGGAKPPLETCYQAGNSCSAGKSLMWVPKGDPCITPCYKDKAFSGSVGGSAATDCKPGFP